MSCWWPVFLQPQAPLCGRWSSRNCGRHLVEAQIHQSAPGDIKQIKGQLFVSTVASFKAHLLHNSPKMEGIATGACLLPQCCIGHHSTHFQTSRKASLSFSNSDRLPSHWNHCQRLIGVQESPGTAWLTLWKWARQSLEAMESKSVTLAIWMSIVGKHQWYWS